MKKNFDVNKIISLSSKYKISDSFYKDTSIISFVDSSKRKIPNSWVKVNYKTYPRMNKVVLPKRCSSLNANIDFIFKNRKSCRNFSKNMMSLNNLFLLLKYSAGIVWENKIDWDNVKRTYPSAGARYPIEIYIISNKVKGLRKGLYHYNIKENSLESLLESDLVNSVGDFTGQSFTKKAGVMIILSGVLDRCRIKYGDRGMRYIFMECGHIMQNLYIVSESLNLGCCAIGGFLDDKINDLLDISNTSEKALYMAAVGVKLRHENKKK